MAAKDKMSTAAKDGQSAINRSLAKMLRHAVHRARLDYRLVRCETHSQQTTRFRTEVSGIRAAPGLQGFDAVNGKLFLSLNDKLTILEARSDDGGQ